MTARPVLLDETLKKLQPDDAAAIESALRRPVFNALKRKRRDDAIRQAARFWSDQPPTKQAAILETGLRRYAASGFRHERELPRNPIAEALDEVLRLNDGQPLGRRMIYEILTANSRC